MTLVFGPVALVARASLDARPVRLTDLEVDRLLRLAIGQARHGPTARLAPPETDR